MVFTKKEINRRYRENHKEEIKQKDKERYQMNKEMVNKLNKKYYQNHREKILTRQKEYESHPKIQQKLKIYWKRYSKIYREEHKEEANKYRKERRKIDKPFAIQILLRVRVIYAFKKYSKTGKIFSSKEYGIDYQAIIEHLKPLPENLYDYHIHHIKPLCTFDFNDPEEIKKAFTPENHKLVLIEEHRKINHRDLK